MYPAVHVIPLSLPATERLVPNGMWYQRSERTAISSLSAVQRLFLLVSVSFICSCACVAFLCRSSVSACVTFILFVFRQQKMVQRMQEIVAKYEDRLRQMQSVPRLSYGRRLVCTDGAPKRMFLTCLFCHHVWCRTILIIFRLCLVLFFLLTWHGMVPHNTDHNTFLLLFFRIFKVPLLFFSSWPLSLC